MRPGVTVGTGIGGGASTPPWQVMEFEVDYYLYQVQKQSINDVYHAIMVHVDASVKRMSRILGELNDRILSPSHYDLISWERLRYVTHDYVDDEFGMEAMPANVILNSNL